MPRRNNRETYEPLDLTVKPNDLIPRTPALPGGSNVRRRSHNQRVLNFEHQAECRARKGIDWNICVVPGCGRPTILRPWWSQHGSAPVGRRHHFLDLAICFDHCIVAFEHMARHANEPGVIEAMASLRELREQRDRERIEAAKAHHLERDGGDIYFVQVGDLIKVGWTGNLWARLKQYGASAVLLAHYSAHRSDETHLHRNLRPALAKGREWYHDGPILRRYIDEAIEKHGPPTQFEDLWTVPKEKPQVRRR